MLRFLSIKRLAVIDAVEVEFGPGFNVLTGETGAGKSILVGAVGLLLGGRASGDMVRTGEESAAIEAIFESDGVEIHVRREITAQGRSRAFINGDLATAAALKDLAARLIELHGQHEHHTLLDPASHLSAIDTVGDLAAQVKAVNVKFSDMREANAELNRVRAAVADRTARREIVAFQHEELQRAQLVAGEDEQCAATRQILANAERMERLCSESYAALYDDDGSALAQLGGVWRRIAELAAIDERFKPHLDTRDTVKAQLEDLAAFLRQYSESIDASPARLQTVEERLALLERLKRKYGPTLADVIAKRDALASEIADADCGDERMAEFERRLETARAAYLAEAGTLSKARHDVAGDFPRRLERVLGELALERTRFEVRFGDAGGEESWTPEGIDRLEFFISTNPGEDLRPLARTASGGELSRIMLALRTITATFRFGYSDEDGRPPSGEAPGLIFDEVDAGIGGRVADAVGQKLRTLGSAFQVLCITHLPQIAAYADAQFRIDKSVEQGRTRTSIARLNEDARVEELSRMLGGTLITEAVRASAREMISGRGTSVAAVGKAAGRKAKAKGESGGAKAPGRR